MDTALVAGLVGFAAVLVGAFLQRLFDRQSWRRDAQVRIYARFNGAVQRLTSIEEAVWSAFRDLPDCSEPLPEATLAALHAQASDAKDAIYATFYELVIVGSAHMISMADTPTSLSIDFVEDTLDLHRSPPLTRDLYVDLAPRFYELTDEFVSAARHDLGHESLRERFRLRVVYPYRRWRRSRATRRKQPEQPPADAKDSG
jgi:hypothetical protein